MDRIFIQGNSPLNGTVAIAGAKKRRPRIDASRVADRPAAHADKRPRACPT